MSAPTYSKSGVKSQSTTKLDVAIFDIAVSSHDLIKQAYHAHLSNGRGNLAVTKTRGLVRGGGKKPWRQKGTGRARSGMTSSPIWRKGGRAFPNKPDENFSQKVNRKMYRAGMATILSQLVRDDRLVVVEDLTVDSPKTKAFAEQVKKLGMDQVLFLTTQLDENVFLSSRNLHNVLVLEAQQADPYSLLRFKKIVVTKAAVAQLEEQWA